MHPLNSRRSALAAAALVVPMLLPALSAHANGIYRNGIGARSMALGGADTAWAEGPLGALGSNPAGFAGVREPSLDLGLSGVIPEGEFRNSINPRSELRNSFGVVPDLAFGTPIGTWPVSVGFGFAPEAALRGRWRYIDAPGGADGRTTFGLQEHNSEILLLRSALGVGVALHEKVWFGGSIGLLYSENSLEVPYIFQSHPVLRRFKTLLDLESSGFGWNGHVGFLFRPHEDWQIGITYKSEASIDNEGQVEGNAAAQLASLGGAFAGVRPDFRYDAEVGNTFPHMVALGVSWRPHEQWRLTAEIDWINWGDAFVDLPIKLRNGNNPDLNTFLGTDAIDDTVPLRWKDQFVYRAGVELSISDNLALRAGYSFGETPIPNELLTPLNAAITEHTLTAGAGYKRGRYSVDFAYQYDLPTKKRVGTNLYEAGEYSNSSVEVGIHWIGVTTGVRF